MKNALVQQRPRTLSKTTSKAKAIRNKLASEGTSYKEIYPVIRDMSDQEISELRASFDESPAIVRDLPESERNEVLKKIGRFLSVILARIAPNMADDKVALYTESMTMVFESLPAKPLELAMSELIIGSFRFVQEIEQQVRKRVLDIMTVNIKARRLGFLWFLELRDKREKEMLPKPETPPLSLEEIAAMPDDLLKMGISLGDITEEQVAAAREMQAATPKSEDHGNGRVLTDVHR